MPVKNEVNYLARKEFIHEKIDTLLKENDEVNTVSEAKMYIADNYLFVEPRSIDRMMV